MPPDAVDLAVTIYGGAPGDGAAGEIGGNRILVEDQTRAFFCDFGTRFKVEGRYYEEFLKPRLSTLGLRDPLVMELLPPLEGLYRDDLLPPDFQLRDFRKHEAYRELDHVDGVLVSHAHVDHIGALGFLRSDLPVYTGLASAVIAKAMQDIRGGGPDSEYCYHAPREGAEGILKAVRGAPRKQRQHFICEPLEVGNAIDEFWCSVPGTRTSIEACRLETIDPSAQGMRFWRLDHSIPGSGAFGIETSAGWVIYTGDVRRHGHSGERITRFVEEARALRPVLLIAEGTRVNATESTTESTVRDATEDVVRKTAGLVVADFSPRNVERLRCFHEVARQTDRKLVVTTKDAYLLDQLHKVDPDIPEPHVDHLVILKEPQGTEKEWSRKLADRFKGCSVTAEEIGQAQNQYILCLSYWDVDNLADIAPGGGSYIYSSAEAYTEEQAIDQTRLGNWLHRFGLNVMGGLPGAEAGPFHASGHADGPALEWIVSEIDAENVLPVHTESLSWFRERWPEKVLAATYGQRVQIA